MIGTQRKVNRMDDLISRQAAIDAICEEGVRLERNGMVAMCEIKQWCIDLLDRLPSAQAEPCGDVPDNNVGECEDAVSRADVEHEIANILRGIFVEYQDIAKKTASKLPSVTPKQKTGKWIVVDDADDSIRISGKCSACGWEAHLYEDDVAGMDYCPDCGAKMDEVETNETCTSRRSE